MLVLTPAQVSAHVARSLGQIRWTVLDGICFGVPIFAGKDDVTAALSSSFPKVRVRDAAHERDIVARLQSAADSIARDLKNPR